METVGSTISASTIKTQYRIQYWFVHVVLFIALLAGSILKIIYGVKSINLWQKYNDMRFPHDIGRLIYINGIILFGCGSLLLTTWITTLIWYCMRRKDTLLNYFQKFTAIVMPFVSIPSFVMSFYLWKITHDMDDKDTNFVNSADKELLSIIDKPEIAIYCMDAIPAIVSCLIVGLYIMYLLHKN